MHALTRWGFVMGVAALIGFTVPAEAAVHNGGGDPVRKLGRGVANVLFGFTEIPATIGEVYNGHGPTAAFTWGLIAGIHDAVVRTAIGVVEVATFPVRWPDVGYGPIIEPEFPSDQPATY